MTTRTTRIIWCPPCRHVGRQYRVDLVTATRSRAGAQRAAGQLDPLREPEEPGAGTTAGQRAVRCPAGRAVGDAHGDAVGPVGHRHGHLRTRGVLACVRQRLLHHPVRGTQDGRRDLLGVTVGGERDRLADRTRLDDQRPRIGCGSSHGFAGWLRVGVPEHPDQVPQLGQRLGARLTDVLGRGACGGPVDSVPNAPACNIIRVSWWVTTSCISSASRRRSSALACSASNTCSCSARSARSRKESTNSRRARR